MTKGYRQMIYRVIRAPPVLAEVNTSASYAWVKQTPRVLQSGDLLEEIKVIIEELRISVSESELQGGGQSHDCQTLRFQEKD
ncbi:MAG TPA: hypothetical protein VJB38_14050 [Bacteroidota bacterium]|uniref:Uncharacterized protein n=1 Tax=uncultured Ignavibacteria bacterium Rifle_16ft_4_minimus_38087 TaxID=1665104 RepID=A0A0H4T9Q7_9BACT|nr:hypothetical protein [uncultured Ignavibacteria bacterium Rifle_16ft_4_minimus_38087]HLE33723.1 hypothetical protein [Bacteroidota bacterium]